MQTNSSQAADPVANLNISYDVLAHSNGSFSAESNVDSFHLDLGTVLLGEQSGSASWPISIYNLATDAGLTAGLEMLSVPDPNDRFSLAIPETLLPAGESATLFVTLDTTSPGEFQATWNLPTLDDSSVPGSTLGTPLTLTVSAMIHGAMAGDFDSNGLLDVGDIDTLSAAIQANSIQDKYDLNSDGRVDSQDRTYWVEE